MAVEIGEPMHKKILTTLMLVNALAGGRETNATSPDVRAAAEVLDRAIAYHDPGSIWDRFRLRLQIRETRPDGAQRLTRVELDSPRDSFEVLTRRDQTTIEGLLAGEDCLLTLDGSLEFTEEQRDEYRLTCDHLRWQRNYYTYLWGLPMKLRDPGTRIDPDAVATVYQQRPVWAVRVTYDERVGSDTWYFYFERETFALAGYRFYHDEAKGDGEYILLEGELESEGLKIPARRAWYTHGDNRYLGEDVLIDLEILP
jgi:hypothetical protein